MGSYSYHRGVRIPPLDWEPALHPQQHSLDGFDFQVSSLIRSRAQVAEGMSISFRAYSPQPALSIQAERQGSIRFSVNNVSRHARLRIIEGTKAKVSEVVNGITRSVEITMSGTDTIQLEWQLPTPSNYRFASIGDTGGQLELGWCIQRAAALGAEFLLHLGDFNYHKDDYASAVNLFNHAPIPCYVSIGNHDFHENGAIYPKFLQDVGPLNHQFAIGKTRFANFDTAANTLPYSSGHRGRLFKQLIREKSAYAHTVAFSHRPLYDPSTDGDHDIGSDGERDWLVHSLQQANVGTLLSGHIHIHHRSERHGIDNIIVGQGLGHQDLIVNDNHYSKMAVGEVAADNSVAFDFAPLAMPMNLHCHPRTDFVKGSLHDSEQVNLIKRIEAACLENH